MSDLEVQIRNKNDMRQFYWNLKWYKLFYKKKKLVLLIDDEVSKKDKEELLMIEKAFNMKDEFKRLTYVYQTICKILDVDIANNICEFDSNGLCIAQREGKCPSKINGCCGSCKYITKKGCSISSLSCKTFYCSYIKVIKNIPDYRRIKLYQYFLSFPQKMIIDTNFWNTEEENIKLLYKATIFTWLFHRNKKMKRF